MTYDFKDIKRCGAKARTRGGAPCRGPAMKNGRCRMHGGVFFKRETHGRTTLRAIEERRKERIFLKQMKKINKDIESAL
jgi:hypothetical protein